jgi:beta-glucosidase
MIINTDLQKKYVAYLKDYAAKNPKKGWFMPEKVAPEMSLDQATINRMAASEDIALITIGKTSGEGADRSISESFNLTKQEQTLIKDVCTAFHNKGKKAIVILNICSPIETPSWREMPDAILLAWMGGQEGGNVVADILTGKVNPSGKLTMTFPMKYADVNNKEDFPTPDKYTVDEMMKMMMSSISGTDTAKTLEKNVDYTTYNEGVFVGYRYYDTKNVPVAYPFGYGLSYTEFKYSNPAVERVGDNMEISCEVKNVGKMEGKEVMEVYVAAPGKDMPKPSHELKGFSKTSVLKPGGSLLVQVSIPIKSLASFDEESSSWKIENGLYQFQIASSSRDIKFSLPVQLEGQTTETVVPVLLPENK